MTARATFRSPLGPLAVEVTDGGVCGVQFRGGRRPAITRAEREHLEAALAWLEAYFRGEARPRPALEFVTGSEFDRRVWRALLEIPYGATVSYGELAAALGLPGGARAVGAANGRNALPIIVPCHRVVAADGRLGGYGGGLEVKRWLLAHEAAHAPALRSVASPHSGVRTR
jgi:methylated-DNA-[protein]-cysteine S-methyltransferase